MSSSVYFKRLFTIYKQFERVFFRVDKTRERANYIKLKYQFRMTFLFSFLSFLMAISVLLLHGKLLPACIPLLASVLIGFRYKWYNLPRITVLIITTVVPIVYTHNSMVLSVPTTIVLADVILLVITQSEFYTMVHLIIQTLHLYFYGTEAIIRNIQSKNAEEIARIARIAVYICVVMTWVSFIALGRFYSHVNNLIRKINALGDDISKANSQLNDQNHKLQNNLEMKDVFIYTFSHELKNALNGLLGNLSLAYEAAPKDSQIKITKFLTSAKVCGEVLKNFVHNILDSGKLENGNLEVSPERTDVRSFMENIWTICGRIIENKRLQGFLEISNNVPRYLKLDEQRMIQIILNLVSNACKFTEKGHVRIHVSWQSISPSDAQQQPIPQETQASQLVSDTRALLDQIIERDPELDEDIQEFLNTSEACSFNQEKLHLVTARQKKFITDPQFYQLSLTKWNWSSEEVLPPSLLEEKAKGVLKVQVVDTGCGMTEEDLSRLFRRFSQTNCLPGQRKVGTGLGLWICKELAKGLDGDIKARSVVGVGSVFDLTIKTTVANAIDKFPGGPSLNVCSDSSPSKPIRRQRHPNMKKILIADDDSFNVELMKNYLNKFGIRYICAYDVKKLFYYSNNITRISVS